MKRSLLSSILALLAAPAALLAQNTVVVTANVTANTTWTRTNTYLLDTKIYVTNGATLTIEPGTVIKGRPKANPVDATALVIARGAKINAQGTATNPIIFTAESDLLNGNLTQSERGLWGGVVILGRSRLNTASGQGNVEGIPTTEPLGTYGGTDDDDNSGVFRYVQIRHSGAIVAANVELNGLTMGGVGRGTTIEYVDVYAGNDDGYEWFGGTVNTKYLISSYNDDDNFDWDEGFRGKGQFWFAVGASDKGNQAMEMDGGTSPEDGQPYALPELYNLTLIGSGATSTNTASNGLIFRDNTGGKVYNMILHDYRNYAVRIETESAQSQDSAKRLAAGDLVLANSIFGSFGAGTTNTQMVTAPNATSGGAAPATNYTVEHLTAAAQANRINTDPLLTGISRTRNKGLDPRPAAGSPALSGARTPPADGFFNVTNYIGAFSTSNWAKGWSAISSLGYLTDADAATPDQPVVSGSTTKLFALSKTVLIRAVGPGLAGVGIPTGFLADPVLSLRQGGNEIASNDDWSGQQIVDLTRTAGSFPLTAGSRDAVLVRTLTPGAYTTIVTGKGGAGEVIFEVYEIK